MVVPSHEIPDTKSKFLSPPCCCGQTLFPMPHMLPTLTQVLWKCVHLARYVVTNEIQTIGFKTLIIRPPNNEYEIILPDPMLFSHTLAVM